jgi:hypothetical protein
MDRVNLMAPESPAAVDLYWLPLGAGGYSVRWSGRLSETVMSQLRRRRALILYHSALEVRGPDGRFVIEMTPTPDVNGARRGVVGEGPVGTRPAGRSRLFRYELRRWRDGVIGDVGAAVESPQRLSSRADDAQRLLALVPSVPTPTWGRDELHAGEMWSSNSVTSWLLSCAGLDTTRIKPPAGGRAPGWNAGLVVARRGAKARQDQGDSRRTFGSASTAATSAARSSATGGCCARGHERLRRHRAGSDADSAGGWNSANHRHVSRSARPRCDRGTERRRLTSVPYPICAAEIGPPRRRTMAGRFGQTGPT